MWSDPIADMLTRIRNAAAVRHRQVMIPASKVKIGIAKVLKQEGYVESYDVIEDSMQGMLRVQLKYGARGEDVLHSLRRESKPGCRMYCSVSDIPRVLDGLGIAIVSTSHGVLSDRQCRERNVGGELLCTVY
ncbi:MAG: 30S ribosomal protein S8 [Phycisphaerales bacterium]|jgi:small subunit ribosomal protein S8|nr:MAG: 30S ribosomal protein S8 [Phycisphaerales bacterium]